MNSILRKLIIDSFYIFILFVLCFIALSPLCYEIYEPQLGNLPEDVFLSVLAIVLFVAYRSARRTRLMFLLYSAVGVFVMEGAQRVFSWEYRTGLYPPTPNLVAPLLGLHEGGARYDEEMYEVLVEDWLVLALFACVVLYLLRKLLQRRAALRF